MVKNIPMIRMNNDLLIPAIGLSVFQIPDNETERVVSDAIEGGYRLFDTADCPLVISGMVRRKDDADI